MNFRAVSTRILGALLVLTFAGSALAQEMSVGTGSGQPGNQVTVPIDWTGDGTVDNITVWIDFDETVITPQVTGTNNDVVGCLDGLPASHTGILTTCRNPAATPQRIVLVISDQAGAGSFPTTNVGSITFDIAGGATTGTTETITVDVQEATDSDLNDVTASVAESNGSIDIIDTPPDEISELSVTPASIAFGTVDIGNLPTTDTFTAENVGGANSSLTISDASYTGDTEFTITSNGCDGATLNFGDTCDVTVEFNSATAGGPFSGSFDFTSDADTNANPSVAISGEADSVASLDVNPAFGPVDLGTVVIGNSATANGSISNTGSADGDFTCTLTGDPEISTTPSPLSGTVPAGGSTDFSLTCAVPDTASEGDTFSATLECSGDNGFGGTHDISCGATEFVPFPVPSMNKWGLAVLALLMVMVGGITVRFFRA